MADRYSLRNSFDHDACVRGLSQGFLYGRQETLLLLVKLVMVVNSALDVVRSGCVEGPIASGNDVVTV